MRIKITETMADGLNWIGLKLQKLGIWFDDSSDRLSVWGRKRPN